MPRKAATTKKKIGRPVGSKNAATAAPVEGPKLTASKQLRTRRGDHAIEQQMDKIQGTLAEAFVSLHLLRELWRIERSL